jgi:hypothetical protein
MTTGEFPSLSNYKPEPNTGDLWTVPTTEMDRDKRSPSEAFATVIMDVLAQGAEASGHDETLQEIDDLVGLETLKSKLQVATEKRLEGDDGDTGRSSGLRIQLGSPYSTYAALTLGGVKDCPQYVRDAIYQERGDIEVLSKAIDGALADSDMLEEEVAQKRKEVVDAICAVLPMHASISLLEDGSIVQQTQSGSVQWRAPQIELPSTELPADSGSDALALSQPESAHTPW